MKKIFVLVFFTFYFLAVLNAQIQLRGKFVTAPNTSSIALLGFNKATHSLKLNSSFEFSFKSEKILHGFYQLNNIGTIYLSKAYNLTIVENNIKEFKLAHQVLNNLSDDHFEKGFDLPGL